MRDQQKKLLGELEEYRWHLMRLLADEAEENGEEVMALGWRWLVNNKRRAKLPCNRGLFNCYGWFFGFANTSTSTVPAESKPYFRKHYRTRGKWNNNEAEHLLMSAEAIGRWLKETNGKVQCPHRWSW